MNRPSAILVEESMPYPWRSRRCEDYMQASAMPKWRKKKGGYLTHRNHQLLTTIRCLSTVIFHVNCMACTYGRSVTLTSSGQPGLSFARACMTSQCITSWGLSSNGITSLCPTSWHTPSTRRDPPEGRVWPLVTYNLLPRFIIHLWCSICTHTHTHTSTAYTRACSYC